MRYTLLIYIIILFIYHIHVAAGFTVAAHMIDKLFNKRAPIEMQIFSSNTALVNDTLMRRDTRIV
jgi:hypothetical protein